MQIGTFRKNAMKTVGTKAAKMGLRTVAKNTARTNIANAVVRLNANTGGLLQSLTGYLLGQPTTQEMKDQASVELGDIGYDLTVLCRSLKVKMPSSNKKSKLVGTRGAALLQLNALSSDLLSLTAVALFAGPQMTKVTKTVVLPNKGGAKEEREVFVVDAAAEADQEKARQDAMKPLVSAAVDVFWRLTYNLLQAPPSTVLQSKFERLQKEFPAVEFDTTMKAPKVVAPKVEVTKEQAKPKAAKAPKAAKPETVSA